MTLYRIILMMINIDKYGEPLEKQKNGIIEQNEQKY